MLLELSVLPTSIYYAYGINNNISAYAKQFFIGQKQEAYHAFDQPRKSLTNASNYPEYQAQLAKFDLLAPAPY